MNPNPPHIGRPAGQLFEFSNVLRTAQARKIFQQLSWDGNGGRALIFPPALSRRKYSCPRPVLRDRGSDRRGAIHSFTAFLKGAFFRFRKTTQEPQMPPPAEVLQSLEK